MKTESNQVFQASATQVYTVSQQPDTDVIRAKHWTALYDSLDVERHQIQTSMWTTSTETCTDTYCTCD